MTVDSNADIVEELVVFSVFSLTEPISVSRTFRGRDIISIHGWSYHNCSIKSLAHKECSERTRTSWTMQVFGRTLLQTPDLIT